MKIWTEHKLHEVETNERLTLVANLETALTQTVQIVGFFQLEVGGEKYDQPIQLLHEGELAAGTSTIELAIDAPDGPVTTTGELVRANWWLKLKVEDRGQLVAGAVVPVKLLPGTRSLTVADDVPGTDMLPSSYAATRQPWPSSAPYLVVLATLFVSVIAGPFMILTVPLGVAATYMAYRKTKAPIVAEAEGDFGEFDISVAPDELFQGEVVRVAFRSAEALQHSYRADVALEVNEAALLQLKHGLKWQERPRIAAERSLTLDSGVNVDEVVELIAPTTLPESLYARTAKIVWRVAVVVTDERDNELRANFGLHVLEPPPSDRSNPVAVPDPEDTKEGAPT